VRNYKVYRGSETFFCFFVAHSPTRA